MCFCFNMLCAFRHGFVQQKHQLDEEQLLPGKVSHGCSSSGLKNWQPPTKSKKVHVSKDDRLKQWCGKGIEQTLSPVCVYGSGKISQQGGPNNAQLRRKMHKLCRRKIQLCWDKLLILFINAYRKQVRFFWRVSPSPEWPGRDQIGTCCLHGQVWIRTT